MTVLEYEQFWTSLRGWGDQVRSARIAGAGSVEMPPAGAGSEAPPSADDKVVKTDKVIIGNKTSWAVAQAIGEVSTSHGS